jgi:glucosamine--fructose-6-phosphate aminotransferase (isomerizing)
MCGIVGAVSDRNIVPVLIEGLKRLEYRGYDSAGIAVVNGSLNRLRSTGRVAELAERAQATGAYGALGIAHTRWATHGAPSERNAHPHMSGDLAVVHNGIIENHDAMRKALTAKGYQFVSDTDTEVIAHLIASLRVDGATLLDATRAAIKQLEGAYAIAVVSASVPDTLIVARKGAPLLLGLGDGENFAASDVSALLQVTQRVIYLEEGDCAQISTRGFQIWNSAGEVVARQVHVSQLSSQSIELGPYQHYMQKEIFEQPGAVANTLENVFGARALQPELFGVEAAALFKDLSSVNIVACGTSYHAGVVARYWIESVAGLPCNVEIASEYRYRSSVADPNGLFVTISQSGETADTLAALAHAKSMGYEKTLTICNVPESALMRQSRLRYLTRAGPEIGVASTKAFTTQLASLFLLTLVLARCRGKLSAEDEARHLAALRHLPAALQVVLQVEDGVIAWAKRFASKHHALFLGRGIHYPIALEGALKLKEISYIHAEAYAAGELKHGPLALVDADMPVVTIAPNDVLLEKLKSNMQEVRARGGELYVFADDDAQIEASDGVHVIKLTDHAGLLSPILHVVPLQLLAYHVAIQKGTDVDKPRNLAKSVTVE